jgi:hypothetical protein
MNKDLTIGFLCSDIITIRATLEQLLGKSFQERDSSFHGGRYFLLKDPVFGELTLQDNYDQIEEEWVEEEHTDLGGILRVSCAKEHDALKAVLLGVEGSRLIREKSYAVRPAPR